MELKISLNTQNDFVLKWFKVGSRKTELSLLPTSVFRLPAIGSIKNYLHYFFINISRSLNMETSTIKLPYKSF